MVPRLSNPERESKIGTIREQYFPDEGLPCLIYEATATFKITRVSTALEHMFAVDSDLVRESLVRESQTVWDSLVFEEDIPLVETKLRQIPALDSVSFVHRMLNPVNLPVWVSHFVQKNRGQTHVLLRGCITPILNDARIYTLDQSLVTTFIHKLGNHFQLLNLLSASLANALGQTHDAEILAETLETAAEITRSFADSLQPPSVFSNFRVTELLKAAVDPMRYVLTDRKVLIQEWYEQGLQSAKVLADGSLIEAALSHVLTHFMEATTTGGMLSISGRIINRANENGVANLEFSLCESDVAQNPPVGEACRRSTNGNESLRLAMAKRLVQMHGGVLHSKLESSGVAVAVSLPVSL